MKIPADYNYPADKEKRFTKTRLEQCKGKGKLKSEKNEGKNERNPYGATFRTTQLNS